MESFDHSSDMLPGVGSRPTITDVAKLCGVTPATVSRVLNGKQKFSASEAVRQLKLIGPFSHSRAISKRAFCLSGACQGFYATAAPP